MTAGSVPTTLSSNKAHVSNLASLIPSLDVAAVVAQASMLNPTTGTGDAAGGGPVVSVPRTSLPPTAATSTSRSDKKYPIYYLRVGDKITPVKSRFKKVTRRINRWVVENKGASVGSYGTEDEAAASVAAFLGVPEAPLRENLWTRKGEVRGRGFDCLSVDFVCITVRYDISCTVRDGHRRRSAARDH